MRPRIVFVLFLFVAGSAVLPVSVFSVSRGPSWGTVDYGNFVRSLIVPDDSLVQQKLQSVSPIQDAAHFGQNLLSVYQAASQLPYSSETENGFFGPNWMSASEVLQYGRGDCKNHAILLTTLIEALFKNTYGYLPTDLVWIMGGGVDPAGNGNIGGHVWVLLNVDEIQAVSQDAFNLIRGVRRASGVAQVPVGAEPPWSYAVNWINVNFDTLPDRSGLMPTQSILQFGHLYIELEPTWRTPISEFYYKKYPYVELHDQWNSYQYVKNPSATPPGVGALQLSSKTWHYGDIITWSAAGLAPNSAVAVMIRGSWGTIQMQDTNTDSAGKASYSFTVGTNIQGSGQFIVIDKATNSFIMSDYSITQAQSSGITVNVYSIDLVYLGKDPGQQKDLGASITVNFVNGGNPRTVILTTPSRVQADPFSTVTFSVNSVPAGYAFASKWDDYHGGSQYTGTTFSYNVLALLNHKTAAFFKSVASQAVGASLQLSSTTWHYGDIITWSAQGLTPNGAVAVRIQGSWGALGLWDVTADSSGKAGYSLTVGTNILGSGQFSVLDKTTNAVLMSGYTITQSQGAGPALQLSSTNWHYGEVITWSATGLTPNSVVAVRIQGSGWAIQLWDVAVDSRGNAGYSFTVGTNIPSSGQLVIVDKAINSILMSDYSLT